MVSLHTLSLNGTWKMNWTEYLQNTKQYASRDFDDTSWYDAAVPGDVHLDLMKVGVIPDPYIGTNVDDILWMEQKDWWYRTHIKLPREWQLKEATAVRLLFHGLDCFAVVYLDGNEIARHANMFVPLEVDVTTKLSAGNRSTLAVQLQSPILAPMDKPSRCSTPWGSPRQLARKAQMSYGWDIAPRLVTIGIWRPAELIFIDRARVREPWIRTLHIRTSECPSAVVRADIPVEILRGAGNVTVVFEFDGKIIGRAALNDEASLQQASFEWEVKEAQLWWPNGSGKQHLYPYHVVVVAPDGTVLDERVGHFGIRTITLDRSPTPDGGHKFMFEVNGREIFMRGWNWTPPDALFASTTPERRKELLTLARDSGANMLRVWGGGVYEAPDFYDTCDRMGLLIFQDFMFSCSQYPQDDIFLREVAIEVEHVVKMLRSHPCLAIWSGDNECDALYDSPQEAQKNRINRQLIPALLKQLDPQTPYVPSSPHSPAARRYNDENDSEAHLWRHGETYLHPYFMESKPKFISEIGFLSLPDEEVLQSIFDGREPTWPPFDLTWQFHWSDCIRGRFFRGMAHLMRNVEACGLPPPRSLADWIEATQRLHAEALRKWVERHGARPECGGILLWNLCDCWPQMSDAVIAWPLRLKKSYYAAKDAFLTLGRR